MSWLTLMHHPQYLHSDDHFVAKFVRIMHQFGLDLNRIN